MQLRHLPRGERADDGADRIAITILPNGRFGYAGTIGAEPARIGLVGPNLFRSEEEALAAACDWSHAHGVDHLVVEYSKL